MAKEELYIEAKLDAEQLYADLKKLKEDIEKKKMEVTVNAKMTKDAKQVVEGMNQISEANKKAAKSVEENAYAMWKYNKAVEQGMEAFKAMSPEIQKQEEEIIKLEKQYKTLSDAMKNPVTATDTVRQALYATKIQLADARKELNKMQEPVKQASTWLWRLFSPLKNIASSSLRTGILSTFWAFSIAWAIAKTLRSLINTVKESVQTFISFESAFAGVKKTVEATDYEFDAFNHTLRTMTTYVPMAYEELAKIAELGWQMGVPIENLAKFTETLAAISVSTNLWLEDAALSLSRIASVMGIDYSDVDRLGSAIVDLWNNFAATESEITTFMEKIAWTANVIGLSAWDVAWISAAITSVWVAAEKWWTAVNKMAIAINDAVNKWWDKLKILATITWQTTKEFQELWKKDTWEAFVQVVEWIGNAWQNSVKYIEKLVWTWTRMKEVFLNLSSASDKLREAVERGNNAYLENLALLEEAAKRYWTTESQIQMLNNQISLNKEKLWEELIPFYIKFKTILVDLWTALVKIIDWFNSLNESQQNFLLADALVGLSSVLFVINPLVWVFAWVVSGAVLAINKWYKATNDEAMSLADLHESMTDVNKQLYTVEEKIDKLNQDFEDWKISIDDYTKSLWALMKKQKELKKEQQEISESIAAFEDTLSRTDEMKDAFEERQKSLSDLDEKMITVEKSINKMNSAIYNLHEQLKNWEITQEEYDDKIKDINKDYQEQKQLFFDLKKQQEDWEKELKAYWKTYEEVAKPMNLLNSYTKENVKLNQIFNDLTLDTEMSQQQLEGERQKLEEVKASALEALAAEIALKEAFLWKVTETGNEWFFEYFWKSLRQTFQSGKIKRTQSELAELKKAYEDIQKISIETLSSWAKTEKKLTTEQLLNIDVNDGSLDQLRQNIYDVEKQMWKYNETSEEYNQLLEKKNQLQDRLNEALEEEDDNLNKLADSASKSKNAEEELLKVQEKKLELEAKKKVNALKQSAFSEEDYAKAVLKINEDLEKAKDNLRKDWYQKEVDAMNDVIEKYKELREEAKDALSNVASGVNSVSSDIAKLVKKIQDLRKELEELEKDRVKDLGDRYVELKKTLEEIDKNISELTAKTSEWWDSGEMVYEAWQNIQEWIDEATKSVEDYQSEIDKLLNKISDLEKDTTDNLSDRYAEVVEELWELNKQLEVYTRYDILTDADAKAKQKLEEEIASLLWEKNKIEQNLTDAQLQRAESMVGETETDKILRQAAEQKAAYQQEIDEYQNKLNEQQSILEQYRAEQSAMVEKYNWLDTQSEQAKYDEMIKQLEDYAEQRKQILAEMDMISQNLTAQEIQQAIINSKKTETELILENYYTQKQALEDELADYEDQLRKKLDLLADYYGDAALLKQKYGSLWVNFSDEDLKKIKEASENLKWVQEVWFSSYSKSAFDLERQSLQEQEQAKKQLETIAKNLEKITDAQMKKLWSDTLKELYNKILQLQLTASWQGIGTGNVTNTSNINQSFNVNNINDAAVIASAIRRQIKL